MLLLEEAVRKITAWPYAECFTYGTALIAGYKADTFIIPILQKRKQTGRVELVQDVTRMCENQDAGKAGWLQSLMCSCYTMFFNQFKRKADTHVSLFKRMGPVFAWPQGRCPGIILHPAPLPSPLCPAQEKTQSQGLARGNGVCGQQLSEAVHSGHS
jgi:hypothetical protein